MSFAELGTLIMQSGPFALSAFMLFFLLQVMVR